MFDAHLPHKLTCTAKAALTPQMLPVPSYTIQSQVSDAHRPRTASHLGVHLARALRSELEALRLRARRVHVPERERVAAQRGLIEDVSACPCRMLSRAFSLTSRRFSGRDVGVCAVGDAYITSIELAYTAFDGRSADNKVRVVTSAYGLARNCRTAGR